MIWYLVIGYVAACYLWGMYVVARLYVGRRLRTVAMGGGGRVGVVEPGLAGMPQLRLTDAPMPRKPVVAQRPRSEAA